MKPVHLLALSLSILHSARAEDVYLKNGTVVRASNLRREGTVVFAKLIVPPEETSLIAVNQIEKIVFSEVPDMHDATAAAYAGDAKTVLQKTAGLLTYHNQWHDVPGNARAAILRLAIPAYINAHKKPELQILLQNWINTGDPDLDATALLLQYTVLNADKTAFEKAARAATSSFPGTLCAAAAWMEQGTACLSTGQWEQAARAFLSVRLFSQNWRLLQAPALLGAIEACRGGDQIPQSLPLLEDLLAEYPGSEQAAAAAALSKPKNTAAAR